MMENQTGAAPAGGAMDSWAGFYEKFFCAEGRLNRKQFWAAALVDLGVLLLYSAVMMGIIYASSKSGTAHLPAGSHYGSHQMSQEASGFAVSVSMIWLLGSLALGYFYQRTALRRWHDIGHTEETLLKRVVYPLLAFGGLIWLIILGLFAADGLYNEQEIKITASVFGFVVCLFYLGLQLYLGCASGTAGDNMYGPDPAGNPWHPYRTEQTIDTRRIWEVFFSWKKRLNRKMYMFGLVTVTVVNVLGSRFFTYIQLNILSGIFSLVVMVVSIMMLAQRLHDMGRSSKSFLASYAAMLGACIVLGIRMVIEGPTRVLYEQTVITALLLAIVGAAVLVMVMFSIQAMLLKGDEGENQYGPACLEKIVPAAEIKAANTTGE